MKKWNGIIDEKNIKGKQQQGGAEPRKVRHKVIRSGIWSVPSVMVCINALIRSLGQAFLIRIIRSYFYPLAIFVPR
ncbi:MAG: hypothetical protein ACYSR1_10380 [Planctomycetota bacterium]